MNVNISESTGDCPTNTNALQSKLFLLGERDQLIMTLYYENQMSYREIALLLGVNRSTVLRRIIKINFLKGHSIRKIARRKKTSYYKMRQKIKEIQYILDN